MDLREYIRGIPDFPKPGILFYDISTLVADPGAWRITIERLAETVTPYRPDVLAGVEARGFLVAAALALKLGLGVIMVRKAGKLPGTIISHEYDLEYGTDVLEIQSDAVEAGARVVLIDDLLATGGTMNAAVKLFEMVDTNVVAAACIIELTFLKGREVLTVPLSSLVSYDQ